ncbi:MAG TPA: sulfotransferase domain-containing protein [Dehalococcoidia bacterium]|nr:sulfotransferase domain-containing protein [Dehalococcoidia bacterium]
MIVWVASYPRSGNAYFLLLLNWVYGVRLRSMYGGDETEEGKRMVEVMGEDRDAFLGALSESRDVYAVKTHDVPYGDDFPAIYLVRDGRDALVSYAHYLLATELGISAGRDSTAFQDVLRSLIFYRESSVGGFHGWSGNVLAWAARRARTVVVRFENLIRDPIRTVEWAWTAAGQMGERTDISLPTFQELRERYPLSFRRGQIGSWRTEMSDRLHELFWEHHGPAMRAMQYDGARLRRGLWWARKHLRRGSWAP